MFMLKDDFGSFRECSCPHTRYHAGPVVSEEVQEDPLQPSCKGLSHAVHDHDHDEAVSQQLVESMHAVVAEGQSMGVDEEARL